MLYGRDSARHGVANMMGDCGHVGKYLRVPPRVANCCTVDAAVEDDSLPSTIQTAVAIYNTTLCFCPLHHFPAWVAASGILGEIGRLWVCSHG
jgi:hypothetical protein